MYMVINFRFILFSRTTLIYAMRSVFLVLFTCMLGLGNLSTYAQNPAPGKPQQKPILLRGATLHIGNGQVIADGSILFDNGIIRAIGAATQVSAPSGTEVVELNGKHIFPGLISMATTVGLQEVASVRATLDFEEVGSLNPHVRALVAYDTDSEVIPTLRNTGLLVSQAAPQGGLVSGSSSTFYTDGWNWEDAALKADDGIWLNWPPFLSRSFNYDDFSVTVKRNERRKEIITTLSQYLAEAKAYAEIESPNPVNIRFEAMKGLFTGQKNLYIRASYAKDIVEAIQLAQAAGVKKPVIAGGGEAHKVASFLKQNEVSVIVDATHRLPGAQDENVYLPYELPGLLTQAGVKVAISYAGQWWRTRNLPFLAGTAAGFSDLSPEQALQLVSKNAAEILGVDRYVGTLEVGKHATLVVSKGDLLDMRTNQIEHAFIKGSKVNLDDKQKRLYHKYKEKYGQD